MSKWKMQSMQFRQALRATSGAGITSDDYSPMNGTQKGF